MELSVEDKGQAFKMDFNRNCITSPALTMFWLCLHENKIRYDILRTIIKIRYAQELSK